MCDKIFSEYQRKKSNYLLHDILNDRCLKYYQSLSILYKDNNRKIGADIFLLDKIYFQNFFKDDRNTYLFRVHTGFLIPPLLTSDMSIKYSNDLYCIQITGFNFGHVIYINNNLIYNSKKGNVLYFQSDINEISIANAGITPMMFLLSF